MIKKQIIFTLALILLSNFQTRQNKYVTLEFKVEKGKHDKTTLLIFLNPVEGIHINSEPGPMINFASKDVEVINIRFEKTPQNYIDTKKPITIELKLKSKKIKKLNGELTYFYCSETEGWCSKSVDKFEAKLE